mgnify:CR=1 FL=1
MIFWSSFRKQVVDWNQYKSDKLANDLAILEFHAKTALVKIAHIAVT